MEIQFEKLRIYGVSTIGVFVFSNNEHAIIPYDVPEKVEQRIAETLGVQVHRAKVCESRLLGIFVVGNNHGVIVPRTIYPSEYEFLKKIYENVGVLESKHTAVGNLILANDKAAIVSEIIEKEHIKVIRDVLGVDEVVQMNIGGYITVGAVGVCTNEYLFLPPVISEDELKRVSEILKVKKYGTVTVNCGSNYLRSGIIANDKGIVVGEDTTGPEIFRIGRIISGG